MAGMTGVWESDDRYRGACFWTRPWPRKLVESMWTRKTTNRNDDLESRGLQDEVANADKTCESTQCDFCRVSPAKLIAFFPEQASPTRFLLARCKNIQRLLGINSIGKIWLKLCTRSLKDYWAQCAKLAPERGGIQIVATTTANPKLTNLANLGHAHVFTSTSFNDRDWGMGKRRQIHGGACFWTRPTIS